MFMCKIASSWEQLPWQRSISLSLYIPMVLYFCFCLGIYNIYSIFQLAEHLVDFPILCEDQPLMYIHYTMLYKQYFWHYRCTVSYIQLYSNAYSLCLKINSDALIIMKQFVIVAIKLCISSCKLAMPGF